MDASIIKSLLPGTYTPLPQAIFALTNGHKCIVQKHQWMCGGKLAVKLVKLSEYVGLLVCTAPRQVLEESSKVYTMCCLWCVPVKFAKIRLWLQSFRTTVAHLWIAFHHISSPVSNFGHDCVWDLLKEVELGGTLSFTWAGDTLDMWLKVTSMYLCDTGQPSWLRNASMVFLLPISLTSWHRGAGSELCQNVN